MGASDARLSPRGARRASSPRAHGCAGGHARAGLGKASIVIDAVRVGAVDLYSLQRTERRREGDALYALLVARCYWSVGRSTKRAVSAPHHGLARPGSVLPAGGPAFTAKVRYRVAGRVTVRRPGASVRFLGFGVQVDGECIYRR